MAKKKEPLLEETIVENISTEPLENVMGDRYAVYAKYVIQDRAIPDVRDGLKPVQRRIIFSMFKSNNTFNKPTKKCAHTVGAVMGTFHPHGDSSIYEALARMSQDWKVRYPLVDFQGNNGSIDGDQPAAYRYTEARLSELSNELIRDIEKKTVDMQLNFDDTEFEPIVLPSRFPNLLVNGTEGIAVALATEIPPHNLREVIEAVIYRINHKTATTEDLMNYVQGPDFPGGGIIYRSEGLKNIYLTGRGKIEVAAKAEIVENKTNNQIVITEIPYKVVKSQLVYEIDKIIHSKAVAGMLEIRDESDWKGIRIVIDCKKDAKIDLLLKYLMNKTSLLTSYSANMVAIVDGRPKTLTLLDFVDAYINHQVDVITRKSKYDLEKFSDRLHIVEGLILASLNINEVVDIIKKSKDKADSKVNLMKRFEFSAEQAEAILTMPLYKLSHTDEVVLENEKKQLVNDIQSLNEILSDEGKLHKVIIKDLRAIANKYGDERRTQIQEKETVKPIDKRELIAKEETVIALTRDGYVKRSSVKSFKGSGDNALPGVKDGDTAVTCGQCLTTDYLICFTNLGNYICLPVHKIPENKWKDEGVHVNTFVTINAGEKIIKGIAISEFRNDIFLTVLSKFGQIKRMAISSLEIIRHSKLTRYMRLLNNDEIADIVVTSGDDDLLVLTSNGNASYYNENELSVLGSKAGGVKSINGLGKNSAACLLAFHPEEKDKFVVITDKAHERVLDNNRFTRTQRLGKVQPMLPVFKSDIHHIVGAVKANKQEIISFLAVLSDNTIQDIAIDDLHLTDMAKYAKKNLDTPNRTTIQCVFDTSLVVINKEMVSNAKEEAIKEAEQEAKEEVSDGAQPVSEAQNSEKEKDEAGTFEQISIFDDME